MWKVQIKLMFWLQKYFAWEQKDKIKKLQNKPKKDKRLAF